MSKCPIDRCDGSGFVVVYDYYNGPDDYGADEDNCSHVDYFQWVVHKRLPHDVYIGRPGPWGNPFLIGPDGDRDAVIEQFRDWVTTSDDERAVWMREHASDLRRKTLGCWCRPYLCHGDVLVALAWDDV